MYYFIKSNCLDTIFDLKRYNFTCFYSKNVFSLSKAVQNVFSLSKAVQKVFSLSKNSQSSQLAGKNEASLLLKSMGQQWLFTDFWTQFKSYIKLNTLISFYEGDWFRNYFVALNITLKLCLEIYEQPLLIHRFLQQKQQWPGIF